MKIAVFTGYKHIDYFRRIFKTYSNIIKVNYFYESDVISSKNDANNLIIEKGENYNFLCEQNYELVIVYGWNHIFPTSILKKFDFYNIHPSILPKYRGPIPLVFQLLNCDTIGGVTLHKMDAYIDSGDIYKQYEYKINGNESHISLNIKVMRCISYLLGDFINDFINDKVLLTKQNNAESSYFTYKDLDRYTLNNEYLYEDFYNTIKKFNGLPIKIKINNRTSILKGFSLNKVSIDYFAFQLIDKEIFVLV